MQGRELKLQRLPEAGARSKVASRTEAGIENGAQLSILAKLLVCFFVVDFIFEGGIMVKKGNIEGKIEMKVTIGGLRTPTVFISSTCYDLGHIRKDLKSFIEDDLGYDVMISEDSSFPIDPTKGTLDNCLNVVEKRADILVLIIGSRYGSLTDSGKSITNLEYIKAKDSGIPIYAFVNKSILDMLPVWKDNPNACLLYTSDAADEL